MCTLFRIGERSKQSLIERKFEYSSICIFSWSRIYTDAKILYVCVRKKKIYFFFKCPADNIDNQTVGVGA